MDVMTAILTRHSEQVLRGPAPGEEEFGYLLRGAATFPDPPVPGRPDPWRWILLRGADRRLLDGCLVGDGGPTGDGPVGARTTGGGPTGDGAGTTGWGPDEDGRAGGVGEVAPGPGDAPLLAALVHAPRPGDRLPEWEQLSAATGMVHALILLLHSRGYGTTWRIGLPPQSAAVGAALGLGAGERLLGGLAVGTPAARPRPRKALPDIGARLSVFSTGTPAHAC